MSCSSGRSILGANRNNISSRANVSSLSSIVSYGLSSLYSPLGISSLSSIISYGLSSVAAGAINPGVLSLSSIVSYGLSSVSIVASNTIGHTFVPSSFGGTDINQNNNVDSVANAFAKIDTVFEKLISKPPKPTLYKSDLDTSLSNFVGESIFRINIANPPAFYFLGQTVPQVLSAEISFSYSNTPVSIDNPHSNKNLFTYSETVQIPCGVNYINSDGTISIPFTNFTLTGYSTDLLSNTGVITGHIPIYNTTGELILFDINNNLNNVSINNVSINYLSYNINMYSYSNSSFPTNIPLSNNNPYIFTFRWLNNATYPPGSNNILTALVNFNSNSTPGNFTVIS